MFTEHLYDLYDNTSAFSAIDGRHQGFATTEDFLGFLGNQTSTRLAPDFIQSLLTTPVSTKTAYVPAIPEADVRLFSHVTRSFVNPIVGIVGCVGNGMGVGVLWRQARQQKLSIFWYLLALTITDIIFLALGIVDGIPRVISAVDTELSKYLIAHFRRYLSWIDNTFLHQARYIVVVMSCERLISVTNPFKVKDTWFAKFPVRLVMVCLVFNAIVASPIVINAKVVALIKGNSTEYIFTFNNYDNFMTYWWVAEAIIHSFIPLFILVPINIAIPVSLYKASKQLRSTMNRNSSKQQAKVTGTVMTITLMYIFLSIPLLVMKTFQYANPDFNMNGKYRVYFWFMADLSKCLAYINAANDFLVYFLVSNNYRAIFKAMYCGSCVKGAEPQIKYETNARSFASTSKDMVSSSLQS